MEIIEVKIEDLKPAEYNPRAMTDQEAADLERSLDEFGLVEPIVVNGAENRKNIIIGGHQRYFLELKRGKKTMPVVYVNLPDILKEQELNLRLNKNTGHWDLDMLANIAEDLLKEVGFDTEELDRIFKGLDDNFDQNEELKKITNPVSKLGEVYTLGKHRLICGDSTDEAVLHKLMGEEKAKLLFTSPPYNMGANLYATYKDNLKSEEYIEFNLKAFETARKFIKGFMFWNVSYNKNARFEFLKILAKMCEIPGIDFLELIVWDKGHGMPITSQKMLTRTYENILMVGDSDSVREDLELFYVAGTERQAYFNKKTNRGITNYWRIDTNKAQDINIQACFPLDLPKKAIELMTQRGDSVLDIFGGSFTTMVACEQTNRKAFIVELDPKYCDLGIKRMLRVFPELELKRNDEIIDKTPWLN